MVQKDYKKKLQKKKNWLSYFRPLAIKPKNSDSMVGAGVLYKGKKYITHTTLPLDKSAVITFTLPQKLFIFLLILSFSYLFYLNSVQTIIILIALLSVLYFADLIFGLITLLMSLAKNPEYTFTDEEVRDLKDIKLPMYTILCPLFRESEVLGSFVESIKNIDWPKSKLDVLLLLEETDTDTIRKAKEMKLPKYFRTIIVPDGQPRTKPKACNYGLSFAKGTYLVIYDAEDRPAKDQLKKAYLAFKKADKDTICFQSKLNYYNPSQNLLTRLFTSEYSLWFDLSLPGFQAMNTVIPLGGTSNHFNTQELIKLGGWDPFNVTEDCDLGVRLFKAGKKTGVIDSVTLEEANSNVKNWVRQRSRWVKGYFQTYLVHMRHPFSFFREFGIHALLFQLVIGARTTFMLINPVLWLLTLSYFMFRSYVGATIESLYPPFVFYIATSTLLIGNFLYIYTYMIACAKRGSWFLVKYVYLIPVYWFLASIASVLAMYQLLTKPYYWEKTNHGLHLRKKKKDSLVDSLNVKLSVQADPLNEGMRETKEGVDILIYNWRDIKHKWAGGAEWYIHEIAKRLVVEGNRVTVFCGRCGKNKATETIDGVTIIRKGGFYTVYIWAFLYYIFKFRGRFDIVIDSENGIPFFTPLYTQIPKILLIHHIHRDYLKENAKSPVLHFRNYIVSHTARFLESYVMPYMYRGYRIVTVSESSKEDIIKLRIGDESSISIISPGVDTTRYQYTKKTTFPSFIYLGRLKPYKNIDIAIQAFANVLKKYPKARFTIAGDGESKDSLERLTKELHLSNAVFFPGKVTEETKIKLLSQSWISLQPSSYEGWGMTVIEANAAGTPVLGSNVKGLKDSIQHKKTGLLVTPKSILGFSKAMQTSISNAEMRHMYSKNAKVWAKKFCWDAVAANFSQVIKNELNRSEFPQSQKVSTELAIAETS